jgi:hypothetical protein
MSLSVRGRGSRDQAAGVRPPAPDFRGIDPKALDLTTFSTPLDVPVRRHQHELGIDYWFYARLVLKLAYQINSEPGFDLHDNQFIAELAWGW